MDCIGISTVGVQKLPITMAFSIDLYCHWHSDILKWQKGPAHRHETLTKPLKLVPLYFNTRNASIRSNNLQFHFTINITIP